jgi:hypothetical protein
MSNKVKRTEWCVTVRGEIEEQIKVYAVDEGEAQDKALKQFGESYPNAETAEVLYAEDWEWEEEEEEELKP